MSPVYIKEIQSTKCGNVCKNEKLGKYSLCAKHLEYARNTWRIWQKERRDQGRCCFCHLKSFKGFLRCKKHTLENRERCKAWARLHPYRHREEWERRKRWTAMGLCLACPTHSPVIPGRTRCADCTERRRMRERGETPPKRNISRTWTWITRQ